MSHQEQQSKHELGFMEVETRAEGEKEGIAEEDKRVGGEEERNE